MVNVNQATGTWLVGGELLETEMFGRRKTFWPIKGQWARQTLQGQARRWGAIYTFKWMEWQISTTSSRPRQALCLCHCDGALPESPRVVWRREFWCPEAGWGVRGLICVPPPPTLRTVEDGCARVFCQRPHYPYIFMPLYSPRVFFSWKFLPFKIWRTLCLEMSGTECPVKQWHVPEEQIPHTYTFYLSHCKSTIANRKKIIWNSEDISDKINLHKICTYIQFSSKKSEYNKSNNSATNVI